MPPDNLIMMVSPDGQLGSVPASQQQDAIDSGYRLRSDSLKVVNASTGQAGYVPKSQWPTGKADASKPGNPQPSPTYTDSSGATYVLHPEEQAEQELTGSLENAWTSHAQQQMKLGQQQSFLQKKAHPFVNASEVLPVALGAPAAIEGAGDLWKLVGRTAVGAAKGAGVGAGAGAGIGYAVGGPSGAKTGAQIGASTGLLTGGIGAFTNTPPTLDQEAEQIVQKQMAVKAAQVRAGLEPPAEDTIAEVLRQEFLGTPKKSGVPQNIPLPKATAPTYLPEGAPAPPTVEEQAAQTVQRQLAVKAARTQAGLQAPETPAEDTIAQTLRDEFLNTPRKSGVPQNIPLPKANVPSGSTNKQALDGILKATTARPDWTDKLPDVETFKKLTNEQQRVLIEQAVSNDKQALLAVRAGARAGSAGDLASWPAEQLWSRYMQEFQSSEGDPGLKEDLANELARRGLVRTSPSQVR